MLRDISSKEIDRRRLEAIRILREKGKTNGYFDAKASQLEKTHQQQLELRKGGTYLCASPTWLCYAIHSYGGYVKPEVYVDADELEELI